MKLVNIKEQRQKDVRRLQYRQWKIWKLQRALGYIELETPIRHGWYKEIIITEKADRYKNKAAILEIYDKIERYYWGRTKNEAETKWLNQTSKHLIYKGFPTLSKKQFNTLSFKAQCMCTSFQYRNESKKIRIKFYIRIPKGAYRIKYTRAYVTHRKRIDPNLDSELAFINHQLNTKGYYNISQTFYGWKDYWNYEQLKKQKLKKERDLKELKKYVLEDIINDTISWENH